MPARALLAATLAIALFGCASTRPAGEDIVVGESVGRGAKAARLDALYAQYWEELLKLNPVQATFQGDPRYNDQLPDFGAAEYRAQSRKFTQDWLQRVEAIGPDGLKGQALLSQELA